MLLDIRRFFAPSKPAAPKPSNASSTDEEQKKKPKSTSKVKSPRSDEKPSGKRKKRVIIDSDSEEEKKKEKKTKKSAKETDAPTAKKHPVTYVSDSDSDDTFMTLKKTRRKENGTAEGKKESGPGKAKQVSSSKSPTKSPNALSKGAAKSSQPTVSPKVAAPTPPKHMPISVADFFGSSSVQRSEKRMVASTSTKRKAPSQDTEESLSDEAIAKQLQMDEDMELEKKIHDDEEFARTLAMLDEAPLPKKARVDSVSPSKSRASASDTKPRKDPSPKQSPVKTSSKLAQMKRRQEEEEEQRKKDRGEKQIKISPKKEPISPATSERAATPKTASVSTGATKSRNVSTPKTDGAPKTSPTKPENKSPEDLEKKRANSSAYRNYLNREGPRALGSKEIPQGEENCLEGCVFVLTGVLESLERDDAKSLIERYGGKVTGNVSRKTTYLAESFGTKIINEDELLDLIRTKPGKKSKYEIAAEAENKSFKARTPDSRDKRTPPSKKATPQGPIKIMFHEDIL
uniref:Replication factor C (activator 1) 1 n=1 Tax=Cyprinus carpio carpio TaxID=630221 RepID=A0A9J8DKC9_CYPCA